MKSLIGNHRLTLASFVISTAFLTSLCNLSAREIMPIPVRQKTTQTRPTTVDPGSLVTLALVNEGARLLAAGDPGEAEVVLGRAVVENPESPEAMYNFGLALSFNSKFVQAVQAQLKAIELKEQFPEAYLALGNLYLSLGENEQALTACEQAHQQAHNEYIRRAALFNKGTVLSRLDRFLEAEMALSECLVIDPTDTSPAFALANLQMRQGNYEMALGWLESVSSDYLLESSFLRCRLQLKLKDRKAAGKALAEAKKVFTETTNLDKELSAEFTRVLEEMSTELGAL